MIDKLIDLIALSWILVASALILVAGLVCALSAFPVAFYQAWRKIIKYRRLLWRAR